MTIEIDEILVFKTNVRTAFDKLRVKNVLDASPKVLKWNIDTKDIDCVLRVISDSLTPEQIVAVLEFLGFECTELQ